ncbi:hypothetical protein PR048_022938 [Dryococelus australis]|uniref:Uncharacterized protein n=1 Tax=Dryococelus australis TaxID=614101 RepID=A0ABQ9GSP4_9NEOP|nr:hypothetical protein PR048_022938 [Dryococelus australis]
MGKLPYDACISSRLSQQLSGGTGGITETSTLAGRWAPTMVLDDNRPMRYPLYHDDSMPVSVSIGEFKDCFFRPSPHLAVETMLKRCTRRNYARIFIKYDSRVHGGDIDSSGSTYKTSGAPDLLESRGLYGRGHTREFPFRSRVGAACPRDDTKIRNLHAAKTRAFIFIPPAGNYIARLRWSVEYTFKRLLCPVASSWFETRSEIGSKIDIENCCTIRVQCWTADRDEVHFEPPKLVVRNLDSRSAAIIKLDPGSELVSCDLGSRKVLVKPGISEVNTERRTLECKEGSGRPPRKHADQRHRPVRFPRAKKFVERPIRESNPVRLGLYHSMLLAPESRLDGQSSKFESLLHCTFLSDPKSIGLAAAIGETEGHDNPDGTASSGNTVGSDSSNKSGKLIVSSVLPGEILITLINQYLNQPWRASSHHYVDSCEVLVVTSHRGLACWRGWSEVNMEQRRNARSWETGIPRENLPERKSLRRRRVSNPVRLHIRKQIKYSGGKVGNKRKRASAGVEGGTLTEEKYPSLRRVTRERLGEWRNMRTNRVRTKRGRGGAEEDIRCGNWDTPSVSAEEQQDDEEITGGDQGFSWEKGGGEGGRRLAFTLSLASLGGLRPPPTRPRGTPCGRPHPGPSSILFASTELENARPYEKGKYRGAGERPKGVDASGSNLTLSLNAGVGPSGPLFGMLVC